MKKILFTLLSVLISSNAAAEWTWVWAVSNGAAMYADLDTIRKGKNDHKVKLWTMQSFETPTGEGSKRHLSNKVQWELNCSEEEARVLAYLTYDGKNGTGKPLLSDFYPDGDWTPVSPGSVGETILKVGCDTTIGMHQWTLLRETKHEEEKVIRQAYGDPSSLLRDKDLVRVLVLYNTMSSDDDPKHKNNNNGSIKLLREYDCTGQRVRTIASEYFRANMGVGRKSASKNISQWEPLEEGKLSHSLGEVVCDFEKPST